MSERHGDGSGVRAVALAVVLAAVLAAGLLFAPRRASAAPADGSAPHSSTPLLSADAMGHGNIGVALDGGLALIVPSAGIDLAIGVGSRVDLALHYRTYLGVVHSFGYEAKLHVYRRHSFALAARLQLANAFWVRELVFDLATEDLPIGNGMTATLGARASVTVRRRVRLSFDFALTLGLLTRAQVAYREHVLRGDGHPRALDLGVTAHWMRTDGRGFFVRVVAVVPLRGVAVIGFAPLLELGWSFSL